jgi:hypothetical protein
MNPELVKIKAFLLQPQIPPGFKNIYQWAEHWGVTYETARKFLRRFAGKGFEVMQIRQPLTDGRFGAVAYYKMDPNLARWLRESSTTSQPKPRKRNK